MHEQGEVDMVFVRTEQNMPEVLMKNAPERLLVVHGKSIQNGTL
jgi:hypothetical protein